MFLSKFSIFSLALVSTLTLNSICHAMESEEEGLANPSKGLGNQETRKFQPGSSEWQKENSIICVKASLKLQSDKKEAKELFKEAHQNNYPFATHELAKWAYLDGEFKNAEDLFELACANFLKHYEVLDDQMCTYYARDICNFARKSEGLKKVFAQYQDADKFKAFSGEKKEIPTHENTEELRKLYNVFGDEERDGLFTPSSSDDTQLVMKRPSQNSGSLSSSFSSNSSSGSEKLPVIMNKKEQFENLVAAKINALRSGNEVVGEDDDFDYDAFDVSDDEEAKN